MPSIWQVGVLHTAGKEAREKIIAEISKIAQYSEKNEADVLKYCIVVPRDTKDEKTMYVIEEYATQKSLDDHMASQPVHDVLKFFGANPSLMAAPGDVWVMDTLSSFSGPQTNMIADPYIEVVESSSKSGYDASEKKGQAASFAVLKDKNKENLWRTLEISERKSGENGKGLELKKVLGFLGREGGRSSL